MSIFNACLSCAFPLADSRVCMCPIKGLLAKPSPQSPSIIHNTTNRDRETEAEAEAEARREQYHEQVSITTSSELAFVTILYCLYFFGSCTEAARLTKEFPLARPFSSFFEAHTHTHGMEREGAQMASLSWRTTVEK